MEVYPGIHQLNVPLPGTPLAYLNAYVVKTVEGALLIDTGWNIDVSFSALNLQLSEAGVLWSDLRYIVITHAHPDHYGLVGRIIEFTNAKIVMHKIETSLSRARYVQHNSAMEETERWLLMNGFPEEFRSTLRQASTTSLKRVAFATPDIVVLGDEHLNLGEFDLEMLWTPGHSAGHICLYERNRRVLFAGDHVLSKITPNVSMQTQSAGNPLADYLNSLYQIADLPVDLVLPGHGDVFTDLGQRIEEIEKHHEERGRLIIEAFAGQSKTAYQIAGVIPWSTGDLTWPDLPVFLRRMALTETLAHLEMLFVQGALVKTFHNGIVWYAPARLT